MPKVEPITNPDTTSTDPKYWEKVLTSHGLSAEKGRSPRMWINRGTELEELVRRELFVGGVNEIIGIDEEEFRKESGQVRPKGAGPDR